VSSSTTTSGIPRDPALDSTLALTAAATSSSGTAAAGCTTTRFLTRVIGRRAVCIHGCDAVAVFHGERKLERAGALPRRVVTSLFGKHAVHSLDDEAHRRRNAAFLSLMSPSRPRHCRGSPEPAPRTAC
jgi:fatty-acid peroxygenase